MSDFIYFLLGFFINLFITIFNFLIKAFKSFSRIFYTIKGIAWANGRILYLLYRNTTLPNFVKVLCGILKIDDEFLSFLKKEKEDVLDKLHDQLVHNHNRTMRFEIKVSMHFNKDNRVSDYYRYYLRIHNTKGGFNFFKEKLFSEKEFLKTFKNSVLVGLISIWKSLRFWIIPLLIVVHLLYYSMVLRCMPFNKTVFIWIVVCMFGYWLISGFVFFIKKYQFSKFTSAIQRFWRRSYILFWLIEFSLFLVFFYLTLNSNNESWYMYDQLQVLKTGLFSWRLFFFKLFPLILLLVFGYLFLLTIKWNVFNKHALWLLALTIVLLYTVWVEFYQFFHVVNFYGNFNWIWDIDEKIWSLELEVRKSRTINHYIILMIMLKFWHIVFIFIFWVFFLLRVLELGRVRYPLLSANLQNFLILYLFAWVMMFPWFKFVFRRYLDMPYYWFYINNRKLGNRTLFNDISLYWYGLLNHTYIYFLNFKNFFKINFFYWSGESDYFAFKKNFIKNSILNSLQ